MSNEIERIGEARLSSSISDPFTKDSITDITVVFTKRSWGNKDWYAWGTVDFTRNNTKGQVRFDGKTFDEIVVQVKNFIENEL